MLRAIVHSRPKSRRAIASLAAVLLIVGVGRMRNMTVEEQPEFALPYVEVQAEPLGLSAEEVEETMTLGMEQDLLSGAAWVEGSPSESLPGPSSSDILFQRGTDLGKTWHRRL